MDEDDFKGNESTQEFEHLVPKSFVSAERKVKNQALKALSLIETKIQSLNMDHMDANTLTNNYASLLNEIMYIIKSVDKNNDK